jgi:hypothetical protein
MVSVVIEVFIPPDLWFTPLPEQEDAATAEIARVQLWQWSKYGSTTVSLSPYNIPYSAYTVGTLGLRQKARRQVRRPDLRRGSAKSRQAARNQRSSSQNRKGLHVEAAKPGMAKRLLDFRPSAVLGVGW